MSFKHKKPRSAIIDLTVVIILSVVFAATQIGTLGSKEFPLDPNYVEHRNYIIGSCIFLVACLSIFKINHFPKDAFLFYLWILFGFLWLLSSILNENSISEAVWVLFVIPLFYFFVLPNLLMEKINKLIALALIGGNLPFIILSLLIFPVHYPYKGIFYNYNTLGGVCVNIITGALILLCNFICEKKSRSKVYFMIAMIIFTCAFVLLSGSRLSALAVLIMILFAAWLLLTIKGGIISIVKIMIIIIAIIGLYHLYYGYHDIRITEGFLRKIEDQGSQIWILTGRIFIWEKVLKDISLFGHEEGYFLNYVGKGAHNSIIEIIANQGILAAMVMVLIGIRGFWGAYRYNKTQQKKDKYAFGVLFVMISFWVMSMGEGKFGAIGTCGFQAFLIVLGLVIYTGRGRSRRMIYSE